MTDDVLKHLVSFPQATNFLLHRSKVGMSETSSSQYISVLPSKTGITGWRNFDQLNPNHYDYPNKWGFTCIFPVRAICQHSYWRDKTSSDNKWIGDTWEVAVGLWGLCRRLKSSKQRQNCASSTRFLLTEEQTVAQGVRVPPLFHCVAHVLVQVGVAVWLWDGGWRRKATSELRSW